MGNAVLLGKTAVFFLNKSGEEGDTQPPFFLNALALCAKNSAPSSSFPLFDEFAQLRVVLDERLRHGDRLSLPLSLSADLDLTPSALSDPLL